MRSIMLPLHVPTSQSKQFTLMFAYKTAQNDKQHFNDFFPSGSLAVWHCANVNMIGSFHIPFEIDIERIITVFFFLFFIPNFLLLYLQYTHQFFLSCLARKDYPKFNSVVGACECVAKTEEICILIFLCDDKILSLSLYPVTSTTCNIASRWWLSAVIRMLAIWMLSSRILFLFLSSDSETRIKKTVHGQRGARLFFPFNFIAIYRTDDGRKMEFFFCSTFCLAHIARVHGNGFHWEKSMLQFNSRRTKFWWLEVVDVQMKCERHQTRLIDI